jgi:multiple sugar transport system permease protein
MNGGRKRRRKSRSLQVAFYAGMVLSILWLAAPFYWLVGTSLAPFADIASAAIFPSKITLANYLSDLFGTTGSTAIGGAGSNGASSTTIVPALINSTLVAVGVVGCNLLLGIPAAFGYSRFRFRGRSATFLLLIATRMIPVMLMAVPFFIIFRSLGLINTVPGLIIAYLTLTLPFSIWILKDFFDAIPREIEEAALVDGSGRLRSMVEITLPMARAGLIAASIIAFLVSWGEFFYAIVLTNELTVPPTLLSFRTLVALQYGELAAGAVIASIIPLALGYLLKRYLLRSASLATALKR